MKFRIFIGLSVCLIALMIIIGCGDSKNTATNTTAEESQSNLPDFPVKTKDEIAQLKSLVNQQLTYDIVNSDPDSYKGEVIEWGGRVFTEPERDSDGTYFQVYITGNDKNLVVGYPDPNFQVNKDDYVIVTGVIGGKYEGTNAFGATLKVPAVKAGYIEKTTRSKALAPAISTIPVNQNNDQNGFVVTLTSVEVAKEETRFLLQVTNGSGEKVSFYTYGTKVTQGNKQYDAVSTYNTGEELPSEFVPGVTANGVLVFPAITNDPKTLTLYLDAPHGTDYMKDWKDMNFSINIP